MKVVIQSSGSTWGGNEKWLVTVAAGLAGRGHEIVISCSARSPVSERAARAGIRVTHARLSGDASVLKLLGFVLMLRREKPDVLLITAFKRSFWGGWSARRAGVPRVVERLGIERRLPPRRKYEYAFRNYIDAMIVNAELIRNVWLESAPWYDAANVHVVYNAVAVPPGSPSDFRSEIGVDARTPLIVAAGRLDIKRKGFDTLIEAFSRMDDDRAHLVIAGGGDEAAELEACARASGRSERIHLLGFRNDIDSILRAADVFVLPSRGEGMANVVLEAMAVGCQVVATDVSGVRESIGDVRGREAAGWIVPVDDTAAMATAMSEAIAADEAERNLRKAEMRFRVENWFSHDRMITEVERILSA